MKMTCFPDHIVCHSSLLIWACLYQSGFWESVFKTTIPKPPIMPEMNTITNLKGDAVIKLSPAAYDMFPETNKVGVPACHQTPTTFFQPLHVFFVHHLPPETSFSMANLNNHFPNGTWLKDTELLLPNLPCWIDS